MNLIRSDELHLSYKLEIICIRDIYNRMYDNPLIGVSNEDSMDSEMCINKRIY
jgi:hypothetical protein